MTRRTGILAGILAILLAVPWWYDLLSHQTPIAQPELATMDPQSPESLKAQFNQAFDEFRVILLLSPT